MRFPNKYLLVFILKIQDKTMRDFFGGFDKPMTGHKSCSRRSLRATLEQTNEFEKKQPMSRIFIAVAVYDAMVHWSFNQSIINLIARLGEAGHVTAISYLPGNADIQMVRNILSHRFLQSDYDSLLFIDSDQSFNSAEVLRMIESDKDFIGAIIPKKTLNWEAIARAAKDGKEPLDLILYSGIFAANFLPVQIKVNQHEPLEVQSLGTGLLRLKRQVLNELKPFCREIKAHNGETMTDFFANVVIEGNRRLSEDYSFCQRWREIGGSVWAAPWVKVSHWGSFEYSANFTESLNYFHEKNQNES
jgi:hypothetical protein